MKKTTAMSLAALLAASLSFGKCGGDKKKEAKCGGS